MKSKSADMTTGALLPQIIRYTIPIILTGMLQVAFNAADLIVVGQYCGDVAVAAVGSTGSLSSLIVNLFLGLSTGASVTVAHAIGAKHDREISDAVHTSITLSLISGIALTLIGVPFARTFLEWMGSPEEVIDLSTLYLRIYFAGIIPIIIYNFASAILRAAGDSKSPLIILTTAGVLNVVMNVFFVTVFHMNVAGVALATTLSQAVAAVLVLIRLAKRTDACKFELRKLKIYKACVPKILRIGIPAGINGCIFNISNVIIQSSVNSLGSAVMSGNSAAGNLEGFIYHAMTAFHQTSSNFVAQNYGAKKFNRIRKTTYLCMAGVAVTGLGMGALFFIFARPLLNVYIPDAEEAIGYGLSRLSIILFTYFLCGEQEVLVGSNRGLGVSLSPAIMSAIGVCGFRITWIFTIFRIPAYHTYESLLISYPISWVATTVAQYILFLILMKKKKRLFEESEPTDNSPILNGETASSTEETEPINA